jgi:hypothetical protein
VVLQKDDDILFVGWLCVSLLASLFCPGDSAGISAPLSVGRWLTHVLQGLECFSLFFFPVWKVVGVRRLLPFCFFVARERSCAGRSPGSLPGILLASDWSDPANHVTLFLPGTLSSLLIFLSL